MLEICRDNRVIVADREVKWHDLLGDPISRNLLRELTLANRSTAVVVSHPYEAYCALAGIASNASDVLLTGRERLTDSVRETLRQNGFSLYDATIRTKHDSDCQTEFVSGRITLLTSGTAGSPKLVSHRWETLYTAQHQRNVAPRRWLVPYQVGTYAWYQLVTLGLFMPAQSLIVPSSDDMTAVIEEAARHQVDSISATPTFWRVVFLRIPESTLRSLSLSTITLGGEIADQSILNRLKSFYPNAQITHIYASTEAGACIAVKDGQAGFPLEYLSREEHGVPQLRIKDGRLFIRSPYSCLAATGRPEQFVDSGDLVDVRGDRVYFVGRSNGAIINVGGNKAFPADIESVILAHPSVRWCRVRAVRSPLVGYLPQADIVANSGQYDLDEEDLTKHCARRLPEYAVPRIWNLLPDIPVESTLKSAL